jgi:uncharacterized protein (TIGR02231 family)
MDEVQGEVQGLAGISAKVEVEIPDCPVHLVVVYPDRAEVTRVVRVDLKKGNCEVVLKNLSKALDKDSIRVDGIGPASITEVSFHEVPVTEEEDRSANASAEVAGLEQRQADLVFSQEQVQQDITRLATQFQLLNDFSTNLISSGENSSTTALTDMKTVDGLLGFADTYGEQAVELQIKTFEANEKKQQLQTELKEVRNKLASLKPVKMAQSDKPVMQPVIGVLLNVRGEGSDIQLRVSYIVSNASWKPKYDLRVSSKERTMEVGYFGVVQQNTGEDWVEARLSLSTAMPSIGGSAPKLETAHLNLIPNVIPQSKRRSFSSKPARHSYGYGEDSLVIEAAPAQVTEGLSSSLFDIATETTVPSDNTGHKVAIATIPLRPTFEYDTVPKQVQHAFLRAKVTNASRYPLLEGSANVYLDQSYVTETRLASVAPQEEFSCSLGVDQSVRVVYKPLKRLREESGLLSRTVTYTYHQVTELHNTRSEPATISLTDQLPRSEDEKLKVRVTTRVQP